MASQSDSTVVLTCSVCNVRVKQRHGTRRTICPNCGHFYNNDPAAHPGLLGNRPGPSSSADAASSHRPSQRHGDEVGVQWHLSCQDGPLVVKIWSWKTDGLWWQVNLQWYIRVVKGLLPGMCILWRQLDFTVIIVKRSTFGQLYVDYLSLVLRSWILLYKVELFTCLKTKRPCFAGKRHGLSIQLLLCTIKSIQQC